MAFAKVKNFDDWESLFRQWQGDIGLDAKEVKAYQFAEHQADVSNNIEFGHYKGKKKWNRLLDIPDQRVRDTLLNLIVYQGDTEFASVEQQRKLFETAPSDNDRASLARVMCEEMRHGYQMCYLLVKYFGYTGKIEAQKQLERRSFKNTRLLGSFNQDVNNWLDFFIYTNFVDRDGKYQLQMLSTSAFEPLGRSCLYMLREEAYHLLTGHDGMSRVLKAGVVPVELFQKYVNKWVPTAYDLFGNDNSSSAHWAYVWGLKGRFDEAKQKEAADLDHLNETSRMQYVKEVEGILENLNRFLPDDGPKLKAPHHTFHRSIGDYTGESWSTAGEKLDTVAYEKHLLETLPSAEDDARMLEIQKQPGWVLEKDAGKN